MTAPYPYDTAGLVANPKMQALRDATRAAEQRCRDAVWATATCWNEDVNLTSYYLARDAFDEWMNAVVAEVDAAGLPPEPAPSVDWTDPRWGPSVRFAEPIRPCETPCTTCSGFGGSSQIGLIGSCHTCHGTGTVS